MSRLPPGVWALVAGGALVAAAISVGSCAGDAQRLGWYVFAPLSVIAWVATTSAGAPVRRDIRVARAVGGALIGMVLVFVVLTVSFGINCAA
jgi:heme/copper-type cytochrome/quinol oxidase subunit 1